MTLSTTTTSADGGAEGSFTIFAWSWWYCTKYLWRKFWKQAGGVYSLACGKEGWRRVELTVPKYTGDVWRERSARDLFSAFFLLSCQLYRYPRPCTTVALICHYHSIRDLTRSLWMLLGLTQLSYILKLLNRPREHSEHETEARKPVPVW